jgi:hypothetical protein
MSRLNVVRSSTLYNQSPSAQLSFLTAPTSDTNCYGLSLWNWRFRISFYSVYIHAAVFMSKIVAYFQEISLCQNSTAVAKLFYTIEFIDYWIKYHPYLISIQKYFYNRKLYFILNELWHDDNRKRAPNVRVLHRLCLEVCFLKLPKVISCFGSRFKSRRFWDFSWFL